MKPLLPALLMLTALSACGARSDEADDQEAQVGVGTQVTENGVFAAPANGTAPNIPTATGPGTAFGLTTQQLEDTALLNGAGQPLAEIERVTADAQGNVNGVVVEAVGDVERQVLVPLHGLEPVAVGDKWHLRSSTLTREQLLAMPVAPEATATAKAR